MPVRLSEWPRDPYLNGEIRQWIALHLAGAQPVSGVPVKAVCTK